MTQDTVQFRFGNATPMREVRGTLHLARLAAESLHGVDRMRLEAMYAIDDVAHMVEIDIDSKVGRTLAIVFAGYVRREFGEGAVRMERPEVLEAAETV